MEPLRYNNYDIVFQEVPNEVSLAISITGCPHGCPGCHSPWLWENSGKLISDDLNTLVSLYTDFVTCVCFMGGDHNLEELSLLLKTVKRTGLKNCLYSGLNDISDFEKVLPLLDYLKLGSYIESLGPLNSPSTNQRFYKVVDSELEDETYLFQSDTIHQSNGGINV